VYLFLEPSARIFFTMPQENRSRLNRPNELQQVSPVGMRCEVEIVDFAQLRSLASARAEQKSLALFGSA
jgi:hypothetical protein